MSLVNWKNRNLMPSVESMFDGFFSGDDFFKSMPKSLTVPAVNVLENEDNYTLELAAPGMEKKDFNIEIDNNLLIIKSEEESENLSEEKNYTRKEYNFKSFYRSFHLPENAKSDSIEANYEKGVLYIKIPKKVLSMKETRSIPVG